MEPDRTANATRGGDCWILTLSRSLAVLLLGLAGLTLPCIGWVNVDSSGAVSAEGSGDRDDDDDSPKVYFVLAGPNDGEPINCRVKLDLRTNYAEKGNVAVLINERRLFERPLFQGGFYDDDYYVTQVELDVAQAGKLLGEDFLHPDAGPVRITAQLYSPQKKFVTSYLWSGFVGKPWVEIVTTSSSSHGSGEGSKDPNSGNSGSPAPPVSGSPGIALHPMSKDLLFLVVASSQTDLLKLSPDDSRLLREGRLVETGTFSERRDGTFARTVVNLESLRRFNWPQTFVVLWTYDSRGNWKRSIVSQVSMRP